MPAAGDTVRARSTARRIALIALSTVVLVAGLEALARAVAHATGRERGLTLDPVLGWRPLPDVEKRGAWWGANLTARTNALGWRDKPRTLAKPPGVRRALLLGDSFVFGVGVDDGLRVSEALEREVPDLEAWNLAVTAYGPDQELLLCERVAGEYGADVVIWFVCLSNDVEDLAHRRRYGWAKPWLRWVESDDVLLREPPQPGLLARLRNVSYLAELALAPLDGRELTHELASDPPLLPDDARRLLGAVARRMRTATEAAGARLVCVVIPSDLRAAEPRREDELAADALRSAGLEPLLLRPAFAEGLARGEDLLLADGHWSARGHALAARLVAGELRRVGLAR